MVSQDMHQCRLVPKTVTPRVRIVWPYITEVTAIEMVVHALESIIAYIRAIQNIQPIMEK